jgi:hypothetical protein
VELPPKEIGLFWVFLEIVAALAIAVAIVWWTFPKRSKADRDGAADRDER